jgi:glucokinase
MANTLALGVDLGGTGIKLGLVDDHGRIHRSSRMATPAKSDPAEVARLIADQADILLGSIGHRPIVGVGVGAAGDVEPQTGVIRISPNLHWKNVPLKALLRRRLRYPIVVENDANAAAWAAFVVEAKRSAKSLLCVTLGTGVGGGIVIDGKLYRGATGSAGEVGHMTLIPEGVRCPCGNQGCVERYIGVRAMAAEARHAIEAGEPTLLSRLVEGDVSRLEPLIVQQAARQGDRLANELWQRAGEHLGIGLASVINVLNPDWIVLAGGLSRAGPLLLDPLKRTILKRAFATPAKAAKLVVSKLDQDLGIVGAGLIAHSLGD